ncbi:MAG: GNAT family N-acetyltransferase [Oscillospiraceae bacterium]|nr:GNAT family N-acetyltransferase [Oscillospiraceae bacterium]
MRIAMAQQAIDCGCEPEDFTRAENAVFISKKNSEARRYLKNLPFFFDLVFYGANVVASVDERIADFVEDFINSRKPYSCFDADGIYLLNAEFAKYGKKIKFLAEYWLPDMNLLSALPCAYETRILTQLDFAELYLPQWGNALCADRAERDVLGVGAYDNGQLIALAGCSADCGGMWQIGIDVLPEYRRQGIAAALTSRLAVEIAARGKVPFYCCAWANLGSARNAVKSGFRPAWAEMTAADIEENV